MSCPNCNCYECQTKRGRPMRRGDNIPPLSDYAHWNEDAYYMWYNENKYDMEHADEIIEDDYYNDEKYDPDPDEYAEFDTEAEAEAYEKENAGAQYITRTKFNGKWQVEIWM